MKYSVRISGTLIVEADNEEDARIKAEMTRESEWSWDSIEIDKDD